LTEPINWIHLTSLRIFASRIKHCSSIISQRNGIFWIQFVYKFLNIGCPTRYRTRLAGGPLLRVATIRRTTDTFRFISHTTNVPLFKFRCNIFIGVRIIKEMPGSVTNGTLFIILTCCCHFKVYVLLNVFEGFLVGC
jgi:hypothetical protein